MKKPLLYTFLFLAYATSPLFAENEECLYQHVSSFCKIDSTTIEAIDDFISITIGESITIPALENDTGSGLELKKITSPNCGGAWVFPNDKKSIHYASNAFSGCLKDSIEYEITDTCGISDTAWVFIELNPNLEFHVQVERDCTNADQFGTYALNMAIWGGVPPFIISGSINDTLESPAIVVEEIEDGLPYEIFVTDAAGNEFYDTGGQIACSPCPNRGFYIESIGEVADCLCNGEVVFTFEDFQQLAEITSFEGYWHNTTFSKPIELNDTIPADATVELYGFDTEKHCYYIIYEQEYFFNYKVSDLCPTPCIEANTDITTTSSTESITFNVLENDIGEGIFINQITKPPFCGTVEIVDAAMGILQYTPDESCTSNLLSFDYQIEDSAGSLAISTVKVVINVDESDLVVAVERDCCAEDWDTDFYSLTVFIADGVPPFIISGTINDTLETTGVASIGVDSYAPYQVNVVDAAGNEFFVEGGETPCENLCSDVFIYGYFIEHDVVACLCDGSMIVHFDFINQYEPIESIYGFWYEGNETHPIELGDTIPPNAYFEIFEVQTNDTNYVISTEEDGFWSAYSSDFCTPENYTFEVIDDFVVATIGDSITLQVFQNDLGTGLQIHQIIFSPSCGEIIDMNAERGELIYLPDTESDCSFDYLAYEVEDACGNLDFALVTIGINHGGDNLVVNVERDCEYAYESGRYELRVAVLEGQAPFTISGSINQLLEEPGFVSTFITDGNPYEIVVTDAAGSEFYTSGGEGACTSLCPEIETLYIEDIQEVADCTCEGNIIFHFEEIDLYNEMYILDESWSIGIGDTLSTDTYFDISLLAGGNGCYEIVFQGEEGMAGFSTDFCSITCAKAQTDVVTINPIQPIYFNVLQNDIGEGIFIKEITQLPPCGKVEIVDAAKGELRYLPDTNCFWQTLDFEYAIEDVEGNTSTGIVYVVIEENENDLVVGIQRDCSIAEETGFYQLNIVVVEGTPPFTLSGSVNMVLEDIGVVSTFIDQSSYYHIKVVDADGNEFYRDGGQIYCLPYDSVIVLSDINEIAECTCAGEMIFHFENILSDTEIIAIDGFWRDEQNNYHSIVVGDTIPNNAFFVIEEIETTEDDIQLAIGDTKNVLQGYISDFCTFPPIIEAKNDLVYTHFEEALTFNILQNDEGVDLRIKSILENPDYGEITAVNTLEGTITYQPNENINPEIESFIYEVEDACENSTKAEVILINEDNIPELIVVVSRDCSLSEETGTYILEVEILAGIAPFIISGTIDRVLDDFGSVSYPITDGEIFQINVVDAVENEFHEEGGEISCVHFCPYLPLNITDIEEIADCTCEGVIFTFSNIVENELASINGFWKADENSSEQQIELGDTIPYGAYVEIYHVYIDHVCHQIRFNEQDGLIGNVSDFCPTPCIEANLDLTSTSPTESVTFNVLENDTGEEIFIKQIAKPPFCGTVEIIDAAMGILQYTPSQTCSSNLQNFDYQIEDIHGNRAIGTVKVVINQGENDLAVAVERDCCAGDWLIDLYPLTVYIVDGTPPFTVSGTINAIVDSLGTVSYDISGYEPYEITVEDAEGNEFFVEGGEISCDKLCSEIELYSDYAVEEGFLDCLCNGSLIVSFSHLAEIEEIQSIYGFWYLDNQPHSIELGDTIPPNAYFEIFEVQTSYANYLVYTEKDDFLGSYSSDFCPTPCIEANLDITTTSPIESVTFNVLENDIGEEIFIKGITNQPLCGSVEIIDAVMGEIRYTPDNGCLLNVINFEYEIEDIEGNTAKAVVKVVMNTNESDLVVGIEMDCTNNQSTGNYSLIVTIADGVAPFTITGSLNNIFEEIGVYESTFSDVNPFEVSILDAAETDFFQTGEAIACHTLGGQIDVYHIEQLGNCLCNGGFIVDFEELEMGFEFEEIDGYWLNENGEKIELELGDTIPPNSFFELSHTKGSILVVSDIRDYPKGFISNFCTPQTPPSIPLLNESESQTSTCGEPIVLSIEGGDEGTTYHWYWDEANLLPANPPTGQVWTNDEWVGMDTVYVIAMDANSCQSEALGIEVTRGEGLKIENTFINIEQTSCACYRITFDLVGGTGTYTINSFPVPPHFVSNWIPQGEPYIFEIGNTGLMPPCSPIQYSGEDPPASIPVDALDDFTSTTQGKTIEIDVFKNDSGPQLILIDILQLPTCGEILQIDSLAGIITYQPDPQSNCEMDNFVYKIASLSGGIGIATVHIAKAAFEGELIANVETECLNSAPTGYYRLHIQVFGGTPPYEFSGILNTTSNQISKETLFVLETGTPYEVKIVDALGNTFMAADDSPCSTTNACANLQINPTFNCIIDPNTQNTVALLTYQTTGGDGNYTFNGNTQNDTLQNGDIYQIEVTDGNGCTASVSDTIACHFTSIENPHSLAPNIQLFPNPNNGSFTLSIPLQQAEEVNIEVFNALGQTKLCQRSQTLTTVEQYNFNLDLNSRLYFIRVSGKDWVWVEKMLVE